MLHLCWIAIINVCQGCFYSLGSRRLHLLECLRGRYCLLLLLLVKTQCICFVYKNRLIITESCLLLKSQVVLAWVDGLMWKHGLVLIWWIGCCWCDAVLLLCLLVLAKIGELSLNTGMRCWLDRARLTDSCLERRRHCCCWCSWLHIDCTARLLRGSFNHWIIVLFICRTFICVPCFSFGNFVSF